MKLQFEPRDIWIGIYWKTEPNYDWEEGEAKWFVVFYLCLIPMLPIIFRVRYK